MHSTETPFLKKVMLSPPWGMEKMLEKKPRTLFALITIMPIPHSRTRWINILYGSCATSKLLYYIQMNGRSVYMIKDLSRGPASVVTFSIPLISTPYATPLNAEKMDKLSTPAAHIPIRMNIYQVGSGGPDKYANDPYSTDKYAKNPYYSDSSLSTYSSVAVGNTENTFSDTSFSDSDVEKQST